MNAAGDPRGRIVIVDDDASGRQAMARALERVSFSVNSFADGIEALSFLREHPDTELVVTDLRMPGIDGLEVLRGQSVILLETARLRLRRFTPADLERLVELDADPQVTRYTSFGEPTPRERYEREILPRWFAFYAGGPALGYWAAETRTDDAFVGWFHLRPNRFDAGEQELGYRLRRAAWGRGYATELGRALLAHGFESVGAAKISARALVGNLGSRRVMENCGLRYECDFVFPEDVLAGRDPAERAAVKYSITRPQWLAQRG